VEVLSMRCYLRVLCGALILVTLGCSGGLKLQDVTGKATYAGKPIPYGTIEFIPDVARGNQGAPGSAEIIDGQFSTRKQNGRGVVTGPHVVRITAYEEKPMGSKDETVSSTGKPPLFSGYTVNVDGFLAEHNFEVPESAKGTDIFKPQPNLPKRNDP